MKAKLNRYETVPQINGITTTRAPQIEKIRGLDMSATLERKQRRPARIASPIGPSVPLHVIEWLASDECHHADDAGLIAGLGRQLRAAGLPIDRLVVHLRTLHPEILGRTVAWSPNEPVEVQDRQHGLEVRAEFVGSPIRHVMETLEHLVVRMDRKEQERRWTHLETYLDRDLVELLILPLNNFEGLQA